MIPLRDSIGSRHYPLVNTAIIAANVLVFLHQSMLPHALEARFLDLYGMVPANITGGFAGHISFAHKAFSLLSFQFLHAGFWHILGNMWILSVFGDNVEDRLGHVLYLFFYLLCGLASALTHLAFFPASETPVIGASGAIAGIMGAYFILHPTAKIVTLIPIIIIPYIVELPAFLFLGLWFVLQLAYAAASQGGSTGIAWWAHVGGFVAGLILILIAPRLPEAGVNRRIQEATRKRSSPRLTVITPEGPAGDVNLYGELTVTGREAYHGARKLISTPLGMARRVYSVRVPPGVAPGTWLRLSGLGRPKGGGGRGDLLLRVRIADH